MMILLDEKEDKSWSTIFFKSVNESPAWGDVMENVRMACNRMTNDDGIWNEASSAIMASLHEVQTMSASFRSAGVQTDSTESPTGACSQTGRRAHAQAKRGIISKLCSLM